MADINKTYTSNTLYNDSTGVIAFTEQLKQELINWANYHHVTEELGPDNRPDTQNALNNLFLSVYERFLTFLNDADATEEAINTWKEIENFLADYTDEKTLAEIVAELNANIESRLTVPLESTTGSSTTSTMTQKAITETIDASSTFTTGEKVKNVGIDDEPTAGSVNLVKSGGVAKFTNALRSKTSITFSNQGIIHYNSGSSDHPDGQIYSSETGYKYSNPIFIKQGYQVNVFSRGAYYEAICQCDSSGNFIQTLVGVPAPSPTERQLYTWTATEDCYVRVCGQFYFEGEYAESWYFGDVDVLKSSDIDNELDITKTNKLVSNARVAELIDTSHLANPTNKSLAKAEDVMPLKNTLEGLIETKASDYTVCVGMIACRNIGNERKIGYWYSNQNLRTAFIPLNNIDSIRFSGMTVADSSYSMGYVFLNIDDIDTFTQSLENAKDINDNVVKVTAYSINGRNDFVEIVKNVPYGANYVALFYSYDNSYSVNSENFYCYLKDGEPLIDILSNLQQYIEQKEMTIKLSMGLVDDTDGFLFQPQGSYNSYSIFLTNVTNPYYIEIGDIKGDVITCTPYEEIAEGETYKIYFFNSSYSLISKSSLNASSNYTISVPDNTKYIRLSVFSSNPLPYSERYITISSKKNKLSWSGVRNLGTVDDYILENGKIKANRFFFDVKFDGDRQVNLGWFVASTDYKPTGKKSKLAILYMGSDAYQFNKDWNYFTDNYHSIVFSLVHSGYSVAFCSCLTALYGTSYRDCSGDQLSINCYGALYDYVINNFNVEKEVYLIGYSNGGMPISMYCDTGSLPIKAIAGGAIVSDIISLFRILGFTNDINRIMHCCGVPSDVNVSHSGPNFTEEDYTVLKSQGDILKNYSPLFMNNSSLDWDDWIDTMKNVPFTQFETNQALVDLMSNVKISSKVPIKCWHARDDVNVSYGLEKFYVEAINRGGGRAVLRTMPNNAGKHAMGNYGDPDSIKVENYQFKDGTIANTTLFMSEVLDWFDEFENKPIDD